MTSFHETISQYSLRARKYADLLGHIEATKEPDRELISSWCASFSGKILDLGCGPGHWTNFIATHDKDILGIDPTPLLIETASTKYPREKFEVGTTANIEPGIFQGILAWYSLIHCTPDALSRELSSIHSALSQRGSLLLGYFRGPQLEPFDHAIAEAWYWPDEFIISTLEETGFTILHKAYRKDPDARQHGEFIATKLGSEDSENHARNSLNQTQK